MKNIKQTDTLLQSIKSRMIIPTRFEPTYGNATNNR